MKSKRIGLCLLMPLSLALDSCGTEPDGVRSAAATQIDTIGGVVHLSHSGEGAWSTTAPWRADTSDVVEIGALDGPEPYVFGRVTGVVVGVDGRIFIADDQAKDVRIFSREGEFLARFGRDGEGPGEFRNISGLGRGPAGGLAVLDGRLNRVSLFDAEGNFQKFIRLERPYTILRHGSLVRFDDEGRYYDLTPLSRTPAVDSLGAIRYTPAGVAEDTMLLWTYEPPRLMVMQDQRIMAGLSIPFAPHPSAAIGPDGGIYTTMGGGYRIASRGPAGDTLRILRRAVDPIQVESAARDSAGRLLVERYTEIAGAAPRELPAIPEEMPAVHALQVDDKGYLWVLRSAPDPSLMAWDVFDAAGGFLGELHLPPMQVMHIDERAIAGVVLDEMQVPTVRVIPLARH